MDIKSALLALLILFQTTGMTQAVNAEKNAWQYNRLYGKPFPAIDLELPDSSFYNTSALAGKTVYVDFWFTSCAPCLKEMPAGKQLQRYFSADTTIVFLHICIDNVERKAAWRNIINTQGLQGIHVFYARNQPQRISLPRLLAVDHYPLYLLLHNNKVIGYDAPPPSYKGFVQWALYQANKGVPLSKAYTSLNNRSPESVTYLRKNWLAIDLSGTPP